MAIGKLLKLSAVVFAVRFHGLEWNVHDPAQCSLNEVDTMITSKRHSINKCLRKSGDGNSLIWRFITSVV